MEHLRRDAGRSGGAGIRLLGAAIDDRGDAVARDAQREAAFGKRDFVDAVGEAGQALYFRRLRGRGGESRDRGEPPPRCRQRLRVAQFLDDAAHSASSGCRCGRTISDFWTGQD